MPKSTSKATSTGLVKWDAKLAELAKATQTMEAGVGGGGNFLSIRGGVLQYQGATVEDNRMRVIVVDQILENQWYDQPFDPDNPASPACYAFGRIAKEMVPHEKCSQPQNANCVSCPQMQFGSSDRGKGKACKACQRLALVTEGDMENIEDAEIAYLKLPYFSTVEYAAYTRQLAELYHRPPLAFVTEVYVVPDPKSQFRVKFKMAQAIEDGAIIEVLMKLAEKVSAEIDFPYPEIEAAPAKPAARKRVVAAPAAPKVNGKAKVAPKPKKTVVAVAPVTAAAPVATRKVGVALNRPVKQPKY